MTTIVTALTLISLDAIEELSALLVDLLAIDETEAFVAAGRILGDGSVLAVAGPLTAGLPAGVRIGLLREISAEAKRLRASDAVSLANVTVPEVPEGL